MTPVLLVGMVAVVPGVATAATVAPSAATGHGGTDAAALVALGREAAASGRPVELAAETTVYDQTFVNPDGSRTLVQHSEAQRVVRAGRWVGVDTTLRVGADGRVVPVAAAVEVSFSGGGDSAMVNVGSGNVDLDVGWPGVLPVPVLDGSTATYGDVLPGVDLQLRVSPESYSQVLVVKDRAAAANPALARLTLATRPGPGDTVTPTSGGGFTVTDSASGDSLVSPAPLMWDSRGDSGTTVVGAGGESVDSVTGAQVSAHSPGEGDAVKPIASAVARTSVTLVPDARLLAGDTTKFPLFLDPTVAVAQRFRQMVNKTFPTSMEGTNWAGDEGVGYNSYSGVNTKRLYWDFLTGAFQGTQILGATFSVFQTFAATCAVTQVNFWGTGAFNGGFTWNTQPPLRRLVSSATAANGRPGCNPGGAVVEFDARSLAQEIVDNAWGHAGMGLTAANESSNDYWKRFRGDATFSVTYNNAPTVPGNTRMDNPATGCVSGPGRPVIGVNSPRVSAYAADRDGDNMTGYFEYWRTGGPQIGHTETPVASGNSWSVNLPPQGDGVYSYRAITRDTHGVYSPYSLFCEYQIDTQRPVAPGHAPRSTGSGAVGQWYDYTVTPAGSSDVVKFGIALNSDEPQGWKSTAPGQSQVLSVRPNTFGPNIVRFWSYDAAGNRSESTYEQLLVAGAPPVGRWSMNEASGDAADSAGGRTLALTGAVTRGEGISGDTDDRALVFDGATGYATTSTPMIDTSLNFSLSAWVNLADLSRSQTAAEVDGYQISRAWLGYVADAGTVPGHFTFTLPQSDSRTAPLRSAGSTVAATTGEWVFLLGTYDATTGLSTLYVNGDVAGTASAPGAWNAPGSLRVGTNTPAPGLAVSSQQRWAGGVDEVRVWQGLVDRIQAKQLSNPYSN